MGVERELKENNYHLAIYLRDHFAGSVVGVEVAKHCLKHNVGGTLGAFLKKLVAEIEEDQVTLKTLMERLDVRTNKLKTSAAWAGEKLGRLKLNDRGLTYSDLTRLEELEGLCPGIRGKLALWDALGAALSQDERLIDVDFERLAARAERQFKEIERHRLAAARRALA